jgi:hypothetical protein
MKVSKTMPNVPVDIAQYEDVLTNVLDLFPNIMLTTLNHMDQKTTSPRDIVDVVHASNALVKDVRMLHRMIQKDAGRSLEAVVPKAQKLVEDLFRVCLDLQKAIQILLDKDSPTTKDINTIRKAVFIYQIATRPILVGIENYNRRKVLPSANKVAFMYHFRIRRAKNLPPSVERYVQEGMDAGMDESKAWAIAWSRYCRYKNPNSPHCKKDSPKDYFSERN